MSDKERGTETPNSHIRKVFRADSGTYYIVLNQDPKKGLRVANRDRFYHGDIPDRDLHISWGTSGSFVTEDYIRNHPDTYKKALKKYNLNEEKP